MLKIDVQGAATVKELIPDALLIFLVPPSLEELFERLVSRATETADELETRQRNAAIELARAGDYDYLVINETGEVARTAERIAAIMRVEKRKHPTRRIEL
jgi:guanylate kinase